MTDGWLIASSAGRRARFGALLTFGMMLSVVPQSSLSVLGPLIVEDLRLSSSQFGMAISAYALAAALSAPLVGQATDRFGGRSSLLLLFVAGAAAILGMGLSPKFVLFMAAVALGGMTNALALPATNLLIAANIEPGRRGYLIGAKQSGVQLSHLAVGLAFPPLAVAIGWRQTLMLASVFGLGGLVWAFASRIPETGRRSPTGLSLEMGHVHSPSIWLLTTAGLCMGIGIACFMGYLPLYAHETMGMSLTSGGIAVGLVGLLGAVTRVVWSALAERTARVRATLAWIALISALSTVAVALAPRLGVGLVWVASMLAGISLAAWSGVSMVAAVEAGGSAHVGRVTGLVLLGFMLGMAIGPVTFGSLVDLTSSFEAAWWVVTASFVAAAVLALGWERFDPHTGRSGGALGVEEGPSTKPTRRGDACD